MTPRFVDPAENVDWQRRDMSDRATTVKTCMEDALLLVGKRADIDNGDDVEDTWNSRMLRLLAEGLTDAEAIGRYLDSTDAERLGRAQMFNRPAATRWSGRTSSLRREPSPGSRALVRTRAGGCTTTASGPPCAPSGRTCWT